MGVMGVVGGAAAALLTFARRVSERWWNGSSDQLNLM